MQQVSFKLVSEMYWYPQSLTVRKTPIKLHSQFSKSQLRDLQY